MIASLLLMTAAVLILRGIASPVPALVPVPSTRPSRPLR